MKLKINALFGIVIAAIFASMGLVVLDGLRNQILNLIKDIVGEDVYDKTWFQLAMIVTFIILMWVIIQRFPLVRIPHFSIPELKI